MGSGFIIWLNFDLDPLYFKEEVDGLPLSEIFEPVFTKLRLELLRLICCLVGLEVGVCDFVLEWCFGFDDPSAGLFAFDFESLLRFLL